MESRSPTGSGSVGGRQTPFGWMETAFHAVCAGGRGLRLDLDAFSEGLGLRRPPGRVGWISLLGLREVLLSDPAVTYPGIAAVWAELLTRAQPPPHPGPPGRRAPGHPAVLGPGPAREAARRTGGQSGGGVWQAWQVGCVGMALPALKGMYRRLTPHRPAAAGPDVDVQAALVAGLCAGLRRVDAGTPRLPSPLLWAAWRAGLQVAAEERSWAQECGLPLDELVESAAPPAPFGHPDVVLGHAVLGGLLTASEAGLISETRLGDRSLVDVARQLGLTANAVGLRRRKAEAKLLAALGDGSLTRHGYWPPPRADRPATPSPGRSGPRAEHGGTQPGPLADGGGKHPADGVDTPSELGGKGNSRNAGVPRCHVNTPSGATGSVPERDGTGPAAAGRGRPDQALTPPGHPLPEGGPPSAPTRPAGHHTPGPEVPHRKEAPPMPPPQPPVRTATTAGAARTGGRHDASSGHLPQPTASAAVTPGPATPPGRAAHRRGLTRTAATLLITVVVVLLVASAAWADPATVVAAPASLADVVGRLRTLIVGLLAAVATLYLTIGGVRYLTANGDPGNIGKAKEAFKHAAFGYTLAALAPLLVTVLQQIVA